MPDDVVDQFTIDAPLEEVYRQIQNELNVISWAKMRAHHTFGILADDGYFSFEVVRDGLHSSLVFFRTDHNYTESGEQAVRDLFGVERPEPGDET